MKGREAARESLSGQRLLSSKWGLQEILRRYTFMDWNLSWRPPAL